MNFNILEEELINAIAADEKYQRENAAKFRAVEQKVPTYDDFKNLVQASHLTPLDKKEKIVDPSISQKGVIWNAVAGKNKDDSFQLPRAEKKKHFTEI